MSRLPSYRRSVDVVTHSTRRPPCQTDKGEVEREVREVAAAGRGLPPPRQAVHACAPGVGGLVSPAPQHTYVHVYVPANTYKALAAASIHPDPHRHPHPHTCCQNSLMTAAICRPLPTPADGRAGGQHAHTACRHTSAVGASQRPPPTGKRSQHAAAIASLRPPDVVLARPPPWWGRRARPRGWPPGRGRGAPPHQHTA